MFFIIITYLELAYLVLRFLLNFRIPWFHQILEALKDEEELNRIINTRKERKKNKVNIWVLSLSWQSKL